MITTISGANGFLVQGATNKITNDFISKHGDMGVERVNAAEVTVGRIAEAAAALPFLVDRRLVILESPASNKDLVDKIGDILKSVNDQTDLLIIEPKFDKRSVLYKALKKSTDFSEYNELAEPQMVSWLQSYAKEQGGALSSSDARFLVARVGLNQLRLKNELEKLLSFSDTISRSSIELLVESSPQSSIFDLLDAALSGNSKKAMSIYEDQRKQKVEPQAILALLAWQLHILAVVRAAGQKSADVIASESKISPFVVRKSQNLSRQMTSAKLKQLIADSLALDIRLKSEAIDADDALRALLISI